MDAISTVVLARAPAIRFVLGFLSYLSKIVFNLLKSLKSTDFNKILPANTAVKVLG